MKRVSARPRGGVVGGGLAAGFPNESRLVKVEASGVAAKGSTVRQALQPRRLVGYVERLKAAGTKCDSQTSVEPKWLRGREGCSRWPFPWLGGAEVEMHTFFFLSLPGVCVFGAFFYAGFLFG